MKKILFHSTLVTIVLICGLSLAYFLFTTIPQNQAKPAVTEVKTTTITKEVAAKEKPSLKSIIKATQDKVVQIETSNGQGSGFLYNNKGDIVTNAHVVGYEVSVTIRMSDQQTYTGKVIGRSDHTDIALIRVQELANTTPLKVRKEKAETGDDVVALGSPLGLQNTVTVGIISGLDRSFQLDRYYYDNMYQITAPISPGNSGGPIVSGVDGSVLGINSVKYIKENNIGFSIPLYAVLPTLAEWSKNPMNLQPYEEDHDFDYEIPEYDGDLSEDYSGEDSYYEDDGTDADTDTGLNEEYSEEPYEEYEEDDYYYEDYDEEYDSSYEVTPDDAIYTVQEYYNYVNAGEYELAYDLIGGNWKASSPSLEEFAEGYAQTLYTTITNSSVSDNGDGTYQVDITLEAQEYVNDTEQTSVYNMSYVVGIEDDRLKLLGGEMFN
ncbi:S1C family serine protease [Fictibacillus phosphorivorans]|uniref:S1C family serine protease n=1 Tax=Fictibacillus phosphorivorans TaxID=1221500 RepID=UPI0012936DC5|nr:trypsin-like peptidase domain-containing protein [Fictibacillus phosphorivorans]MQR94637.1 trypsin-like serine protease [Fictibacillus phosphorivorans]